MATYSKLLLTTGGGIISRTQQADPVRNTATILIGLGGTGVDCLKEIKKAVYERLKPDDLEAVTPEYKHIQFIAVDTDKKSFDGKSEDALDEMECFDISNMQIREMLRNKTIVAQRRELDWLTPEIDTLNMGAGAGGIRQAGRFMMMDKANDFIDRVTLALNEAKKDLQDPHVNIHVFAGLGGGTGSGTFLDACYLIKEAIAGQGATMFGYFFLPDVNLDPDRIPMSNKLVRSYIPLNGYAAMQELDYCMRITENGGEFVQTYKGGKQIKWNEQPVDMCHLICATDTNQNVKPHAYDYAMKVATEYIMDFLTQPADEAHFGISSHLQNYTQLITSANQTKQIGANLAYCILGASCASVPMREINTYLATKVFEKFSAIQQHTPTQQDVVNIALAAKVGNLQDLLMEVCSNGGLPDFVPTNVDWKEAKQFGDGTMVDHYEQQYAMKVGVLEKNAKSMMDSNNHESLIGRVQAVLDMCARDLERGTSYASKVIHASQSHNLLNVVDGLIEQNAECLSHAQYQMNTHLYSTYERTRDDFRQSGTGLLSGIGDKYRAYVNSVENLNRCKTEITMYEQMGRILRTLREQLETVSAKYYQILAKVMNNLIATFIENDQTIKSWATKPADDSSFVIPLVTVTDLQKKLDQEVEDLSIPNLLDRFIGYFISNPDAWIQEDENKITKLVTHFFVNDIFGGTNGFANKTITGFLEDKYQEHDPTRLANYIYEDFMKPLSGRAGAMFPFDASIWDLSKTDSMSTISVPNTANAVMQAAQMLFNATNRFKVNGSALTDRIYLRSCVCALPMGSYKNCSDYEYSYYTAGKNKGRHYYEGHGGSELFNHWEELPPITPVSQFENLANTPDAMRHMLEDILALYDKAVKSGMIKGFKCRCLTEASRAELRAAGEKAQKELSRTDIRSGDKEIRLRNVRTDLADLLDNLSFEDKYELPQGSAQDEDAERIRRDYFVSSPAICEALREDIDLIDSVNADINAIDKQINKAQAAIEDLRHYAHALFTGVISFAGVKVACETTERGISNVTELSNFNDKYPFKTIPLYQGYLSYKALNDEEKEKIKAEAEARIQNFTPEIGEAIKAFGAHLTDEKNASFAEAAKIYPAIYDEAVTFIKQLGDEYRAFRSMFGL